MPRRLGSAGRGQISTAFAVESPATATLRVLALGVMHLPGVLPLRLLLRGAEVREAIGERLLLAGLLRAVGPEVGFVCHCSASSREDDTGIVTEF